MSTQGFPATDIHFEIRAKSRKCSLAKKEEERGGWGQL
jgi:hypothetical protein